MMKNHGRSDEINHNPNWSYIPDHPYRIFFICGSGSEKTNALLNLKRHQRPDIGKIYLCIKDPFESKNQLLINGRTKVVTKILKYLKAFINYSQKIDEVYENLEDHNRTRKRRVLIVFDDVIADMESNKKLSPIVNELFLRLRKLNISLSFISKSYFKVPKTVRVNATHYVIIKIPNEKNNFNK